jgi:signal transduction histidine kinase
MIAHAQAHTFEVLLDRINRSVDWFIPERLKASSELLQAVRMFLFSHLFGPFLGHTISLSMLYIEGHADTSWWIFFIAVTSFWPFPLVLRFTGWYLPLALISIENLMFCILWGSYQYGGISSPILPWLVTVPLLAFFYLPERSTRITVGLMIVANLLGFYTIYTNIGFPQGTPVSDLVFLGLISTFCASVYVSMMALYYGSVVSSQAELEQEVNRHQLTAQKLRDATSQAERAMQAKSEFLAKMSHELRNPLNSIIGYSEMLIDELNDRDAQRGKDLAAIRDAGHRLRELIDDLLDLSKLEAGKMELSLESLDVRAFVYDMERRFRDAIESKGNEFVVRQPQLGYFECDYRKICRVVENLLSNAAKYTDHGRVVLEAWLSKDTFILTVADTGVGIPERQLKTIFDTFGSSEDETSSNYGDDVRLGLPLAHRYCRLLGGTLSVQSAVGTGSTFTIVLPVKAREGESTCAVQKAA